MSPAKKTMLGAFVALVAALSAATPASADLTVAAGCSALAWNPFAANGNIVATNDSYCTGPVYDVRVNAKLWQLKSYWFVAADRTDYWGTVTVSRSGLRQAWANPGVNTCFKYIGQATTTWTYSNGSPGSSIHYSPTVFMRKDGNYC